MRSDMDGRGLRSRKSTCESRGASGFSLLELTVVVFVMLVISMIAIPNIVTIVSTARLHGGATSLSGILQNCRMTAVKENRTKSTHFIVPVNGPLAFVKNATDTSMTPVTTDPQAELGAPMRKVTTPSGPD